MTMTMEKNMRKAKRTIRRFLREQKALAATEFALALPFLLTLYLGFAQLARVDAYHSRVGDTASTINDLVAKLPQVGTAQLDAVMLAGAAIAGSIGPQIQVQVIGVSVDDQGDATVLWSRGRNATPPAAGLPYDLPDSLTNEAGFIVVTKSEYNYDWSPTKFAPMPPVNIKYNYYHVPRSSDITDCVGCNT
ncbi:TadE/TadG family type IV pilus assembly protein [Pseudahrensia aquimaris]|uniref:TadE/TadG family type IV pilus assembly protein n=1 Tax=Pseudahrensia aquimaris TaxID=744461 RepID=A0ABW3FJV0_9HYPH